MKIAITIGVVVLVVIGLGLVINKPDQEGSNLSSSNQASLENSASITDEELIGLPEKAGKNEIVILDVRSEIEYAEEHIVNAELFNVERLLAGELPQIAKNETIYVYCRSGSRSAQAKKALDNAGYENVIDLGGINDLKQRGIEIVKT